MRCTSCGHDTPGWAITGRGPRRRFDGDPERHRLHRPRVEPAPTSASIEAARAQAAREREQLRRETGVVRGEDGRVLYTERRRFPVSDRGASIH